MIQRICPVCQASYPADPKRLAYGRQTTCSRKCSYDLRGQALSETGEQRRAARPAPLPKPKVPRKKRTVAETTETKPCGVCGKATTRAKWERDLSKAEVFLCSRACHYKARSMGLVKRQVAEPYKISDETRQAQAERMRNRNSERKAAGTYAHTEETKAKLSVATARAISEGRIPHISQLEKDVGVMLAKLGVQAESQYLIRLPSGRIGGVIFFYLKRRLPSKSMGHFGMQTSEFIPVAQLMLVSNVLFQSMQTR